MASEKEIIYVVKTLKKFVRRFETPVVTEVSKTNRRETPFQVLIACLLSLRTRDTVTEKVVEKLFAVAETPRDFANMPLKRLEKIIRPVNYYKTKAARIRAVSKTLLGEYGGKVPATMEHLLSLHGVGRKTANIVMVYGHRKEGLPVDVHCWRIPNRIGWISEKTPERAEIALRAIIPKRYWNDFNDIFVTFGQNHCLPRNPKCATCPVAAHCKYYHEVFLKNK